MKRLSNSLTVVLLAGLLVGSAVDSASAQRLRGFQPAKRAGNFQIQQRQFQPAVRRNVAPQFNRATAAPAISGGNSIRRLQSPPTFNRRLPAPAASGIATPPQVSNLRRPLRPNFGKLPVTPQTQGIRLPNAPGIGGEPSFRPQPLPPAVNPKPPAVTPQPLPPAVNPKPPVVTPQPLPPAVNPKPPVVTPQPLPPIVNPKPPVVTPVPPIVNPKPPVVTPTPPVVNPPPVAPQPWCGWKPKHCWWWFDYCRPLRICRPQQFVYCNWYVVRCDYLVGGQVLVADASWYLGLKGMMLPGKGLGVESVDPKSPADLVGLKPGMVITRCNDVDLVDEQSLAKVIQGSNGILKMRVLMTDGGDEHEATVVMKRIARVSY